MKELNALIHEKTRFAIMVNLFMNKHLSFKVLKKKLHLTDGNLSAHLRRLENAAYIKIKKTFKNRRPHTEVYITEKGLEEMEVYLDGIASILKKIKQTKEV